MANAELLSEIERFLAETGMGPYYFGQCAVRNSKLVSRLRDGRAIEVHTAERVRDFITSERERRRAEAKRILKGCARRPAQTGANAA